jgi:Cu+-exporting ATPase
MKKEKYMITGMSCSACSSRVEKVTSQLPGMVKASVNLLTGTMQTTYDEHKLNSADIIKAVVKAGYGANLADGASKASPTAAPSAEVLAAQEIKTLKTRLELSVLFLIPLALYRHAQDVSYGRHPHSQLHQSPSLMARKML